ncbi:MAG TPA: hypothetical protein VL986_11665 [Terracidiphilus sp.]|nr:hypothetical protein [Terracidiphilus sp.]
MNPNSHNSIKHTGDGTGAGEDTLRLIAGLPAPEGLEERVHSALRFAPRTAHVLAWPLVLRGDAAWVRATAAAAIVMVVVGGGWGVYSRIQPSLLAKSPVPARVGGTGGFSNADARRSPQTLQPPVVSATPKTAATTQPQKKGHKKAAATAAQTTQATPAPK